MRVRPATPQDAEQIARIHIASWRVTYADALPAEFLRGLDPGQRVDRWRASLQDVAAPAFVLVAETDHVVGFCHFGPSRDADRSGSGELYAIYVDPDAVGGGAGRMLLAESERMLVAGGFADAILWVLDQNADARAFYERLGWAAESTRKTAAFGGVKVVERRHAKVLASRQAQDREAQPS